MIRATVTSKGRITLPQVVRKALRLHRSSVVMFEVRDGEAVLRPADGGFMARFATIPPSQRPEDWDQVRERTREEVARDLVASSRQQAAGSE